MKKPIRAGIITQARMTSTRLPGKIFLKAKGVPLLKYHVERLWWSGLPVYIATTTNATDDVVVKFAEEQGIEYYRGSEDNVLSRFYHCARKYSLDIIIRVTSDCPLIDGYLIKDALNEYTLENDPQLYLSNSLKRSFPRGFDFEIFSFELLEDAFKNAVDPSDIEHVTPYLYRNRSGSTVCRNFSNNEDKSDIRITVDTPEDLELIQILIEKYNAEKLRAQEIVNIFEKYPELLKINRHIEQKKI